MLQQNAEAAGQPSGSPHSTSSEPASAGSEKPGLEKVGVVVIHGVGDAELGWINDHIVRQLIRHQPELQFKDHSEVYRLVDSQERRRPRSAEVRGEEQYFRSVVRRARLGTRADVSFAELNWADLSRVGSSTIEQTLSILKLYFEAPHTIGANLLQQQASGIHAVIRWLVLSALWILRWPIAGLQFSIFGAAFGYMVFAYVMRKVGLGTIDGEYLPAIVVAMLTLTAALGVVVGRWRAKQHIGLTSLGLATAVCSAALIVIVILLVTVVPVSMMGPAVGIWGYFDSDTLKAMKAEDAFRPATYLAIGGWFIIGVWAIWNLFILAAIAIIVLVALSRLFRPAEQTPYPLRRPAAAAALAVIQGIIWKLVICPASVVVINALVPEPSGSGWAITGFFGVDDIRTRMFLIAASNTLISMIVACVVYGVCRNRNIAPDKWNPDGTTLPRLIVHPSILFALMSLQVVTVIFYYLVMRSGTAPFLLFSDFLKNTEVTRWFDYALSTTPVIAILPHVLALVTESAKPILHVARDLVDHQYQRRINYKLLRILLPKSVRRDTGYPRRAGIQARLTGLMTKVVRAQDLDRLVFLTHSQGTVIMYDYLRSAEGKALLDAVPRVDIITLASPLSHLYQYYFPEYEPGAPNATSVSARIATWTNMWRVDDPIGDHVGVIGDGFIENRQLGPGGHVNYWKEPEVCEAILRVIDPAVLGPSRDVAATDRETMKQKGWENQIPPLFPLLLSDTRGEPESVAH